ncbi:hypothetical protein Cgig2_023035 [Carnegiea gigantea]|uniref:MULE transposase domain-containing protein n=1 Tax=Carnegiea gigantea TaxID=171969 RepID=A0A9Q1K9J5_9CARY|nr:hypothetical protein Cgig2_023035 [Carnegiea gigantea]
MYTLMSDRHKGIIKALRTAMPTASRRTCVIHYYKNFALLYPGAWWFHAFFYIAANAYAQFAHEKAMEKIREKDPGAYHWLRDNEKLELWARFKFDTNIKCDDNTNNFVESFNHAITKFRNLPILTMLKEIRKLIGSRNLYNHIVHPIASSQMWEKRSLPDLDPPYAQRKTDRPSEHKRRESLNAPLPEYQSQQLPHKVLGSGTTRKRRPIEGRVPKPRGRPKKQKAATLTPTPSTTATAQAGPSTQCSQVGASQAT